MSGRMAFQSTELGDFDRFRRVQLDNDNISEVLSVIDSEGHQYFEVDNLSQNVVFKAIRNTTSTQGTVPNILRAVPVPRRFVVESDGSMTYLQFGYGSDAETALASPVDPANVVLKQFAKAYINKLSLMLASTPQSLFLAISLVSPLLILLCVLDSVSTVLRMSTPELTQL